MEPTAAQGGLPVSVDSTSGDRAQLNKKHQKPLQMQTTLSDSFEESSGSPNTEVEI
ncbi:unknown protein [Waddlia chondrophila 2032/99]|uniref:Uncharacterized protein n=1 Tax=Waddlia chondrophila 2032/99 TaxID=765953 RepID=F8LFM5_9BACT|nr:unknown protein [Waddlia chondrophila 2032/99]